MFFSNKKFLKPEEYVDYWQDNMSEILCNISLDALFDMPNNAKNQTGLLGFLNLITHRNFSISETSEAWKHYVKHKK